MLGAPPPTPFRRRVLLIGVPALVAAVIGGWLVYAAPSASQLASEERVEKTAGSMPDDEATRFLMHAASRCNIEAMSFVGNGYETGLWFPRDVELGAAFNLVAWRLTPGYAGPQPGDDMALPVERLAARICTQYCQ